MGKEKVLESVKSLPDSIKSQQLNGKNILLTYLPIIIGLVCLFVCYILYKKYKALGNNNEVVSNIEKQFTNYMKEQSEVNMINNKKFNAIMSQLNQLNYLFQNTNSRETNTVTTQMSPQRETTKDVSNETDTIKQPKQREMMPTSIQTSVPIKLENEIMEPPVNTTKKNDLNSNDVKNNLNKKVLISEDKSNKKVINLNTLKDEVLIEEASSDEED